MVKGNIMDRDKQLYAKVYELVDKAELAIENALRHCDSIGDGSLKSKARKLIREMVADKYTEEL